MKKILILIAGLLMLSGCSLLIEEDVRKDENLKEIIQKVDNKETFAFVIGSDSCPACKHFKENGLRELEKEKDTKLLYVDLDFLTKAEEQDLIDFFKDNSIETVRATPTTYFISDGNNMSILEGSVKYETLVEEYDKFIEE